MHVNTELRAAYQLLLNYVKERSGQKEEDIARPTDVERHFLNVLKLVIEGGWVLEEREFFVVLELIGAKEFFSEQLFFFLLFAADLLQYERATLIEWYEKAGFNMDFAKKKLKMFESE